MVAWGHEDGGGDCSNVYAQLAGDVLSICSIYRAFAALKADGSVVSWGDQDDSEYFGNFNNSAARNFCEPRKERVP